MAIEGKDILIYEKKDKIVTITLNRPERMNAESVELLERLSEAWAQFRDDDDAWVAILTGAGDKAFCTGFDLIDQAERAKAGNTEMPPIVFKDTYQPKGIWKPIIAAINGFAVAGGWRLAQDCDIRIAADHAQLGIPETKWNMPAYWVTGLSQQMQLGHLLEVTLWGDAKITAQRGYEMGFINKVVSGDNLMEEAYSWAERMCFMAPRCVRNLKKILYRSQYLSPEDATEYARALEQNLVGMEDSIEGQRAFAEKRSPQYKNR